MRKSSDYTLEIIGAYSGISLLFYFWITCSGRNFMNWRGLGPVLEFLVSAYFALIIKALLKESEKTKKEFRFFGDRIIRCMSIIPLCVAEMTNSFSMWAFHIAPSIVLLILLAYCRHRAFKNYE